MQVNNKAKLPTTVSSRTFTLYSHQNKKIGLMKTNSRHTRMKKWLI